MMNAKKYCFFNQEAMLQISEETGVDLDAIDMLIFDFINSFANSDNCTTFFNENKKWYWISHNLIIQGMPGLKLKSKSAIIRRINKLVDANLLIKNTHNEEYGKTFYAFGEMRELYEYTQTPTKKNRGSKSETHPYRNIQGTLHNSTGVPYTNIQGIESNNIDSNDSIIYAENQKFSERETQSTTENPFVSFLNSEETKSVINLDSANNSQTPPPDIAPAPRPVEKKKETVFDDCELADYEKFMAKFSTEEYQKLDMNYYYHAVKNWSEMNNKIKRTERGWAATVRTFILNDKNKKSLKLKEQEQKPFDFEAARRYLNNEF